MNANRPTRFYFTRAQVLAAVSRATGLSPELSAVATLAARIYGDLAIGMRLADAAALSGVMPQLAKAIADELSSAERGREARTPCA